MRHEHRAGPDERRAAHYLRRAGVGPDALDARNAAVVDELRADFDEDKHAGRIPDWWRQERPDLTKPTRPVEDEEELVPLLTSGRDPAPAAPTVQPEPEPSEAEATSPDEEQPAEPSGRFAPAPDYWPRPRWPTMPAPVQRVAISPKTRAFLHNAAAAAAGYVLGLAPAMSGWLADCGTHYSVGGALVLGIGGCIAVAHLWDRRTRHWWWGLALAARIPLASAWLALGLYAPGTI